MTPKFQSQTFKVARYCARNTVEVQDLEAPMSARPKPVGAVPWDANIPGTNANETEVEG